MILKKIASIHCQAFADMITRIRESAGNAVVIGHHQSTGMRTDWPALL